MAEIFDSHKMLVLADTMLEHKEKKTFEVKNEDGEVIASFEASPDAAAIIIYLVEEAAETQRRKVAKWMTKHGFKTGAAQSLEDLLEELSVQIKDALKELRRQVDDLGTKYASLTDQITSLKERYNARPE